MSTITKERLEPVIERLEHYATNVKWTNVQAAQDMLIAVDAMRIALASLEAEPVAWRHFQETPTDGGYWVLNDCKPNCSGVEPLYAAPPAPVSVPDEVSWEDVPEEITEDDMALASAWAHGFNQCRAAMLQGAENAESRGTIQTAPALDSLPKISESRCSNPQVIPDGLRLALSNAGIAAPESDEMLAATCEKYIQALVTWVKERKPFRSAVIPDGWVLVPKEATSEMINSAMHDNVTGEVAEIYELMLAAAPQQEVKP